MITFTQSSTHGPVLNSHYKFLAMLPQIHARARVAFRRLPAEEREELIQEVVANCYVAYTRLVKRGKVDFAFATPLAMYAIRQTRAGRRVGARLNVRDMTSAYARKAKGISVERLDRYDGQLGEWKEILVEDKKSGPAEVAAARIDMASWLRSLPPRNRRIAKLLAKGETTEQAAKKFGISPSRVSQLRGELHRSWQDFHGPLAAA